MGQGDQDMSTSEAIQPNMSGITSEIAGYRARHMALHNSRLVCFGMMGLGVCSMIIGICMMLMVISLIFPLSAISFMRVMAAAQWGLGGLMMCYMCPSLFKWSGAMLHKRVKLDERGADFVLGTKKKPIEIFMPWEEITSIKQQRVGKVQQFTISGTDGSYAQFTSYSFFRPKHIARLIAERAGVTLQKA
jgi:hypothetical protein